MSFGCCDARARGHSVRRFFAALPHTGIKDHEERAQRCNTYFRGMVRLGGDYLEWIARKRMDQRCVFVWFGILKIPHRRRSEGTGIQLRPLTS